MSKNTPAPASLFFVVADGQETDGLSIAGVPVASPCLSLRGGRKAVVRVRKWHPAAYIQERRSLEFYQQAHGHRRRA